MKAITPQDCIPDHRGREVTELQTQHERQRKCDAAPTAIDAALDDSRGGIGTEQKWGRPVEPVGHR